MSEDLTDYLEHGLPADITVDFDATETPVDAEETAAVLAEGFIDMGVEDAEAVRATLRDEIIPVIDFEGHDGEWVVASVTVEPEGITDWNVYDEYRK